MKNNVFRFFTVEHSLMMLIAIVLITVGHSKAKKATTDEKKFKTLAIFFTLALIIILAAIPWPFREVGMGRGWF
jgi:NADH:ubiquinone oxidoreductase subunit 2 (subunit N)